jgi:hypothetical protein
VSFAAITLCVASQRVFIAVSVYFIIDSVRKLLDIASCSNLLLGLPCVHFPRGFLAKILYAFSSPHPS